MPGGDGTGPMEQGPMTGHGMGYCMLRIDKDKQSVAEGFIGINGRPIHGCSEKLSAHAKVAADKKEVIKMPGGDGTGPMGQGPMTGRSAGYCTGYSVPGYVNPGLGRGWGFGRGRGAGSGRGFGRGMGFGWRRLTAPYYGDMSYDPMPAPYSAPTREQELEMLKSQAEGFKGALQDIQQRISELEVESKEKT